MSIRVVCPQCSTQLNVKDEHAGRAVKCPKCGTVIPPAQPAATPPPLPATPPPLPPEAGPQPASEGVPPGEPKPPAPAKPTAKAGSISDMLDEMRPGRRSERDRDRDRDRDEGEEDDRPRRRRDRNDEDDDRDRPRPRRRPDDAPPQKKGSGVGLVLLLVGGGLLLCCGGVGAVGYYLYTKGKEFADQVQQNLQTLNPSVNATNFEQLKVGSTTRGQCDTILGGKGRPATVDDLKKIFPPVAGSDYWQKRIDEWTPKVQQNRAMVWQNGEDYALCAFHPDGGTDARLQFKEWRPKSGSGGAQIGNLDDARFLELHPSGKPGKSGGTEPSGPAIEVKAEELAKEYKDDPKAADARYKDKLLVVEGKLSDLTGSGTGLIATLDGLPAPPKKILGFKVWCSLVPDSVNEAYKASRGQTIKLRGKCGGANDTFVNLFECRVENLGPETAVGVTAAALINDYAKDEKSADAKYKDKELVVRNGLVEKVDPNGIVVTTVGKKGGKDPVAMVRIQVSYSPDHKARFAALKAGDRVTIKGECSGLLEGKVYVNRAWPVP